MIGSGGISITWANGPNSRTGLLTRSELDFTRDEMQAASENPDILVLMPRMSRVWGRKPL